MKKSGEKPEISGIIEILSYILTVYKLYIDSI